MKIKITFYISTLILCLTGCSTATNKNESRNIEKQSQIINSIPKVDVEIKLRDSILNKGDEILLEIKLTNKGNEVQKLLFDKPTVSTGGPWSTIGSVIDEETKTSVLKYENKAMLSSQIYMEDQLKDKYYNLQPGQSIEKEYDLSDIVVFNSKDNQLTTGIYEVQIFYHINASNTVTLRVK